LNSSSSGSLARSVMGMPETATGAFMARVCGSACHHVADKDKIVHEMLQDHVLFLFGDGADGAHHLSHLYVAFGQLDE
jgi:hypothetical protein